MVSPIIILKILQILKNLEKIHPLSIEESYYPDMINMMKFEYTPSCVEWIYTSGDAIFAVAVSDKDSPKIHIYDGQATERALHVFEDMHKKPVVVMKVKHKYFKHFILFCQSRLINYSTILSLKRAYQSTNPASWSTGPVPSPNISSRNAYHLNLNWTRICLNSLSTKPTYAVWRYLRTAGNSRRSVVTEKSGSFIFWRANCTECLMSRFRDSPSCSKPLNNCRIWSLEGGMEYFSNFKNIFKFVLPQLTFLLNFIEFLSRNLHFCTYSTLKLRYVILYHYFLD